MADVGLSWSMPRVTWPWSAGMAAAGLLAAGLAVAGARSVEMPVNSDYGLIAALPALFWVGLVGLNLVILTVVVRPVVPAVMVALQVLLTTVLYGLPAFVVSVPRTEVAWRHLGIAQALGQSGHIDPTIDAYFNWPGLFAGLATLVNVTGASPEHVALVAPVVNGLLWTAGVAAVLRAVTPNLAHVWLATTLFTLTNWFDQDYLSPQALAFFLYLVAVALVLGRLGAAPEIPLRDARSTEGLVAGLRSWWDSRRRTSENGRESAAAVWLVIALSLVIVASHQLTPFMLLGALGVLTVTGRCAAPRLVVVISLIVTVWLVTAAATYMGGHPVLDLQALGAVAQSTVTDRLGGSPGHVVVARVRTGLTVAIYLLAGLGWLRSRRTDRDLRPLMLMLCPFAVVPFQPYGGEILMRSALFGLPFAAYYAAAALLPMMTARRRGSLPGVLAIATLLSVALVTGRFGNATFDMFTKSEIEGSQALYRLAPPDSVFVTVAHPTPWRFEDYASTHLVLTDLCRPVPIVLSRCLQVMSQRIQQEGRGAMLMVNRSSEESVRVLADVRGRGLPAFERALVTQANARLVFENADTRIYRFPAPAAGRR
jgi:hypothetical protein